MSRLAMGVDRAVVFLTGLALLAGGAALVAWQRGVLAGGRAVNTAAPQWASSPWWYWVTGGTGLVLLVISLRWLATHHRAKRARHIVLRSSVSDSGASDSGVLHSGAATSSADAAAVAAAAADVLSQDAAITKAHGTAIIERGRPTIVLTAHVPVRHGVEAGVRVADDVARSAAAMLDGAVAVRAVLSVDRKAATVVR
jgi:hypothetical protein